MGLRTQLYALEKPMLSPCYREDHVSDFRTQTIAETAYQIPLTWLAMFRPGDIREESIVFAKGEEPEIQIAPVATMEDAKRNLIAACDIVRTKFPQCPRLPGYFEIMAEELSLFSFPYVTIDATELYPEIVYRDEFADPWVAVLSGFEPGGTIAADAPSMADRIKSMFGITRKDSWLRAINNFVEFSPEEALPHADYGRRGETVSPEETACHARLLPGGVYHKSVWNP